MIQQIVLPRLVDRSRLIERIAVALRALPADHAYRVEVHEHKSKRSDAQNRYLWGVVYPTVTKHLEGWSSEDVHEYCLGEHFGWEKVKGLGKTRLRPLRRSSRLSKLEFMDYVSFIQQRMAEHGIVIPDPDQDWMLHEDAA